MMRLVQLTPGTGHFYCGSCLRDNALAVALSELGHDMMMVPLYLPFQLERPNEFSEQPVRMGGINMYLQQKLPALRFTPRVLTDLLDRPGLLRWASTKGNMTDASDLGELTLSMLRGEEGRQKHELLKFSEWLRTQPKPDVICLSNVMLTGMARLIRSELGVPILCHMQGEAPFLDSLTPEYRERAWATLKERCAEIDMFVAVSESYGALLRERLDLPPERVRVVRNGIDLSDFEGLTGSFDPPTIGYLARMCADKGLPTLVDAFLKLKAANTIPNLKLAVAGVRIGPDEQLQRELERKIEQAGFAADAHFEANVSRERKLEFLRDVSVLSVPATYGESFGLYVVEALAAGIPVVEPRHGAFPELIERTQGGVLCEPDDADSLAQALAGVLSDPEAARAMGERGRKVVAEQFSARAMARGVADVCESMLVG